MADDLPCAEPEAAAAVQRLFATAAAPALRASVDDDRLGPDLRQALAGARGGVVVALPAAQDPIVAVAGFLHALAAAAPPGTDRVLLLFGRGNVAPAAERLAIWRRFAAIQRLGFGVEAALPG